MSSECPPRLKVRFLKAMLEDKQREKAMAEIAAEVGLSLSTARRWRKALMEEIVTYLGDKYGEAADADQPPGTSPSSLSDQLARIKREEEIRGLEQALWIAITDEDRPAMKKVLAKIRRLDPNYEYRRPKT